MDAQRSSVELSIAGDGIAGRGPAYGMPAVRVDGGDARAVYNATRAARDIALQHSCPVLIEARACRRILPPPCAHDRRP